MTRDEAKEILARFLGQDGGEEIQLAERQFHCALSVCWVRIYYCERAGVVLGLGSDWPDLVNDCRQRAEARVFRRWKEEGHGNSDTTKQDGTAGGSVPTSGR